MKDGNKGDKKDNPPDTVSFPCQMVDGSKRSTSSTNLVVVLTLIPGRIGALDRTERSEEGW